LFLSYPVILSIENHCSVPQQKKMAQYLTEILGDKLDVSAIKADESGRLPSPEALRGKILVKVKSELMMQDETSKVLMFRKCGRYLSRRFFTVRGVFES